MAEEEEESFRARFFFFPAWTGRCEPVCFDYKPACVERGAEADPYIYVDGRGRISSGVRKKETSFSIRLYLLEYVQFVWSYM